MSRLSWYTARLKRMSAGEVAYRVGQTLVKRQRAAGAGRHPALHFSTPLPRLPPLTHPRTIRFFDVTLPYTGEESLDWHRDYSTGICAPQVFYGRINYRNAARVGDVKYIWELNRHQFLVGWALNYAQTGDEEDIAAIIYILTDWIASNPRYIGINWASSLELALRILSWGIVFDLCKSSDLLRTIRPAVERSVTQQADYIRHSLSLYSSANNHLIGELAGLLAAGAYFPEATSTRRHAEFAREKILEEAVRQTWPDGVNREQAIYYHHYTLEYMATAIALFERLGYPFPQETRELVHKMVSFVDAMVDPHGEPFEIGDRDDGTVTGLNVGTGVGIYESLLWTGWRLFGEEKFARHAAQIATSCQRTPALDARTAYWHGQAPLPTLNSTDTTPPETIHIFREGGHFTKGSRVKGTPHGDLPYFLHFKAGPFGYPSIAAHSHADQLALCLRVNGHEVLTDAGTYCYHGEDHWRRYFKGTAAHNTIRVDQQDQARYAGPFLWATHAKGELQGDDLPDDGAYVIAGVHDGYHRLPARVDHSRTLEIRDNNPARWLTVRDTLASSAAHTYELIWNFGPDIQVEMLETTGETQYELNSFTRATLRLHVPAGLSLTMTLSSEHPFRLDLFHGNESMPAGWFSRSFGRRDHIFQLRATVQAGWWGIITQFNLVSSSR